jgi:PhzF family phenazine biosynthesis protein
MMRRFRQVDVFCAAPLRGNPVAVVIDAEGLNTGQMREFARWTNLSEATFLLPPTTPGADYLVRIFNLDNELPFAGHPTLGTCHAWLEARGKPADPDRIVQECGAGLVPVRRTADGLGFAAPPLVRSGPVDEPLLEQVAAQLRISRNEIVDANWADNGPGWIAVLLESAQAVLALRPGALDLDIGVAGRYPRGAECAFEVRAFFPVDGRAVEDPVTGSFNASLAQWLLGTGKAEAPYVVSQGTELGRQGRVHLSRDEDGAIWVAGGTTTVIAGEVDL